MSAMIAALMTQPASGQRVDDYITIGSAPAWIKTLTAPPLDSDLAEGRERLYALIDYQNRHDVASDHYYTRIVTDLLSSSGVEDQGTLSVDFDPAYETVRLHYARIIRGEQVINAIDMSEAMVFRAETDRKQMIFNGGMTFSLPILDLRVGDRLDYAYSLSGRNPAIKTGFLSRRSFNYSYHASRLHYRIGVHEDLPLQVKNINNAPEPRLERDGPYRVHIWDRPDPEVNGLDEDTPPWAYRLPAYELSSLENWGQVGDLFAAHYERTVADLGAIADITQTIRAEHSTDKERARAAVDWVQSHIRYVAINLGEGGFVPRRPERVLRRRFGDCKDVTLLLLTLLDDLGIEAHAVLVDLDERGGEFDGISHPYAFNHIMVMAQIEGQDYPMDATRDPQMGTLDAMEKGDIRRGLRLDPGQSAVIDFPQNDYEFREKVTDRFDFMAEDDAILYTLEIEEYGQDADNTAQALSSQGQEGLQSNYVEYLQDIYPSLTLTAPLSVTLNHDRAHAVTRMGFKLSRDDDRTQLRTRAYQILARIPKFQGGTREAPLQIQHPRDVIHIREYVIDEDWDFDSAQRTVDTQSFTYRYEDIATDDLFTENYRWTSKRDFLAADTFEADMTEIKKIIDWNYSVIGLPTTDGSESVPEPGADADSDDDPLTMFEWIALALVGFAIIGFGVFLYRDAQRARA